MILTFKKYAIIHLTYSKQNIGDNMNITDKRIDNGKSFDWGRVSSEYAKYRDIYPQEFYDKIISLGLCTKGQKVLDVGTGTGVLPRHLYEYGANFIGTDISENQIEAAKILAKENNQNIQFIVSPAEDIDFPQDSFDIITACQCFFYFDYETVIPNFARMLKNGGKLAVLYMAWLPFEDKIAGASEELILKYNPKWSGAGETKHPINLPKFVDKYFDTVHSEEFDLDVPFTRESWNGRMKACRGTGASLTESEIEKWELEHKQLLDKIADESFDIKHYAAIKVLQVKK